MYQCLWCQASIKFSIDPENYGKMETIYLCPECLIDICPKPEETKNMDEKDENTQRQFPRIPVLSEIMITFGDNQQVLSAMIADLSETGLKLRFLPSVAFPADKNVRIGIAGKKHFYQSNGSVQWKRDVEADNSDGSLIELGVQFEGIKIIKRAN